MFSKALLFATVVLWTHQVVDSRSKFGYNVSTNVEEIGGLQEKSDDAIPPTPITLFNKFATGINDTFMTSNSDEEMPSGNSGNSGDHELFEGNISKISTNRTNDNIEKVRFINSFDNNDEDNGSTEGDWMEIERKLKSTLSLKGNNDAARKISQLEITVKQIQNNGVDYTSDVQTNGGGDTSDDDAENIMVENIDDTGLINTEPEEEETWVPDNKPSANMLNDHSSSPMDNECKNIFDADNANDMMASNDKCMKISSDDVPKHISESHHGNEKGRKLQTSEKTSKENRSDRFTMLDNRTIEEMIRAGLEMLYKNITLTSSEVRLNENTRGEKIMRYQNNAPRQHNRYDNIAIKDISEIRNYLIPSNVSFIDSPQARYDISVRKRSRIPRHRSSNVRKQRKRDRLYGIHRSRDGEIKKRSKLNTDNVSIDVKRYKSRKKKHRIVLHIDGSNGRRFIFLPKKSFRRHLQLRHKKKKKRH